MTGFSPQQQVANVQTGNQVAVVIGGTVLMFAQTVGLTLPLGAEQLYGIGTSKPQEIPQLRMSPQCTLDNFKLTQAGYNALQGGQNLAFILVDNNFDLYVYDGITGATLIVYVGAKAQNYAQNIPVNAVVRETLTFLAMDVLDGQGNSIMNSVENAIEIATSLATGAIAVAGSPNLGLNI